MADIDNDTGAPIESKPVEADPVVSTATGNVRRLRTVRKPASEEKASGVAGLAADVLNKGASAAQRADEAVADAGTALSDAADATANAAGAVLDLGKYVVIGLLLWLVLGTKED